MPTATQSFALSALRNDNFAVLSAAVLSAHPELSSDLANGVATRYIEQAFRRAASERAQGLNLGAAMMSILGIMAFIKGGAIVGGAVYPFQGAPPPLADAFGLCTAGAAAFFACAGWAWKQAYSSAAELSKINEALGRNGNIATLQLSEGFYGEADKKTNRKIEDLKTG